MRRSQQIFLVLLLSMFARSISAMGIRSFVVLPLEQGGMVFRLQDLHTLNNNNNVAIGNFAYGITGKQTLLLGLPYRLSPNDANRSGDLSALYRYTAWQQDFADGTYRLGLLGGGLIPTNNDSDGGAQGGAVATFYQGRHELDVDGLWGQGFGQSPNQAQYDLAYQYRLIPAEYPESGLAAEWDLDVEYNGRWRRQQSQQLIHQATMGLQWIHPTWVLEAGVIQDINGPHDTQFIMSARIHV